MNNHEVNEIKQLLKKLGYNSSEANILIREYESQHIPFKDIIAMLKNQIN